MRRLRAVTGLMGATADLMSRSVVPEGCAIDFEFEDLPGIIKTFRRMVRGLELDVCEMALTTYLCAREHGVEFIALPIFPVRAFHHGAVLHNAERPVHDPREPGGP